MYGGSGKDLIRADWYQQYKDLSSTKGDVFIYGDYKYGEDALDKDLWGDADIIHAGIVTLEEDHNIEISAGDGDDIVYGGEGYYGSTIRGENGDDTVYMPQGTGTDDFYGYGGDGDDTFIRTASYGDTSDTGDVAPNTGEYVFGGAGNDIISGTHNVVEFSWLYGGDGEDKIYGGDANPNALYIGGDGDDWIESGDNATGDEYIYGDSPDLKDDSTFDYIVAYGDADPRYVTNDRGDDVIYGGDNVAGDSYIHGGYGNDKIIGGHGLQSDYVKIYGDSGKSVFDDLEEGLGNGLTNTQVRFEGSPNDGDDLIDFGDSPEVDYLYGYGQGGNDKIIGG